MMPQNIIIPSNSIIQQTLEYHERFSITVLKWNQTDDNLASRSVRQRDSVLKPHVILLH